jgi:dynein heavy chain
MSKLQKQIDKSQSTQEIEQKINTLQMSRSIMQQHQNEQQNYIVMIDKSELAQASISKVDEWLQILGDSLKQIATKELRNIIRDTEEYEKALKGEMGAIEQLKALLNVITEIKNKSMDMEFRIVEVQEQFRVLKMYDYTIEEEVQKEVECLMTNWEDLLEFADRKDFEVNDFKKSFSEVTKTEVEAFKVKIVEEYEKYMSHGPGTLSVQLDEGCELLAQSKE